MKIISVYIYLIASVFAVSCDMLHTDDSYGYPVYVTACTQNVYVEEKESKAPYTVTSPSGEHPLEALVLATTDSYEYKVVQGDNGSAGPVHVHTAARFTGTAGQLLNGVLYNSDQTKQSKVYFSALSPQTGWTIDASGVNAAFTFDGSQDVMFAPQTEGSYKAQKLPKLQFSHLLTLVNLHMYAENENVAFAWGKVKSVKIYTAQFKVNGSNKLNVNLYSNPQTVEFVENNDLLKKDFYYVKTNTSFPGNEFYDLEYPSQNQTGFTAPKVGYVMLSPVDAQALDPNDPSHTLTVPEFKIAVETEKRNVVLDIDLINSINGASVDYFTGSTQGKQFNFTLKFTMGNTVAVQASVTEWVTGGYGVGDVIE